MPGRQWGKRYALSRLFIHHILHQVLISKGSAKCFKNVVRLHIVASHHLTNFILFDFPKYNLYYTVVLFPAEELFQNTAYHSASLSSL